MNINLESSQQNLLAPALIFVLSLLDDALFLGLSQLGLHLSWLQRFFPVIIACMLLYPLWQFFHHRFSDRTPS